MGVPPGNRPAVPRDWFPYLNGTSQGELVLSVAEGTPEDARKDGHIRARSKYFIKYPGWNTHTTSPCGQCKFKKSSFSGGAGRLKIEAPCSKTCRRAQVESLRGMRLLEHFRAESIKSVIPESAVSGCPKLRNNNRLLDTRSRLRLVRYDVYGFLRVFSEPTRG
jgi:hypothetical protein